MEQKSVGDSVTIKGFASVAKIDRDREIVDDPASFDVPTFMSSPTLLMNHKFLKDEYGNDSSAGIVTLAVPSYIYDQTDDEFIVHSLQDNKFVDTLAKSIAPKLKVGDRGLFIQAEVRHPIAKEKVLSGELGGLSWRGFVNSRVNSICDGIPCKALRQIDLIEISIVHHQNQPQSTFMMAKSANGDNVEIPFNHLSEYPVYGIRFSKSRYPSAAVVSEYMKALNISVDSLEEDAETYVAYTQPLAKFNTAKSLSGIIGDLEVILAPQRQSNDMIMKPVSKPITTPVKEVNPVAETSKKLRLYLLNEQGLLTRFPGLLTQSMKSVLTVDGDEIEIFTMELPDETPVAVVEESVDNPSEEVVSQLDAVVEDAVQVDPLEMLRREIEALKLRLEGNVPVEAVVEEIVAEVVVDKSPEIQKLKSDLEASIAKTLKIENQNQELQESVKSLIDKVNKQLPNQPSRDEVIDTQKSLGTPQDQMGSFISRTFFNGR